jgi:hypothetical protein
MTWPTRAPSAEAKQVCKSVWLFDAANQSELSATIVGNRTQANACSSRQKSAVDHASAQLREEAYFCALF